MHTSSRSFPDRRGACSGGNGCEWGWGSRRGGGGLLIGRETQSMGVVGCFSSSCRADHAHREPLSLRQVRSSTCTAAVIAHAILPCCLRQRCLDGYPFLQQVAVPPQRMRTSEPLSSMEQHLQSRYKWGAASYGSCGWSLLPDLALSLGGHFSCKLPDCLMVFEWTGKQDALCTKHLTCETT